MVYNWLKQKQNLFIQWLEKQSSSPNWELKVIFAAIVLAIVTAPPLLFGYKGNQVIDYQIEHLFQPLSEQFLKDPHDQKHAFRLTIPVLSYSLGLKGAYVIILQYLAQVVLYFALLRLSLSLLRDKVSATLVLLGFVCTFAGKIGFFDTSGCHFDNVALMFILLAIWGRHYIYVIWASLTLAYFTDERSFGSSLFVLIFFFFDDNKRFLFDRRTLTVLFSWVSYAVIRYFLWSIMDIRMGEDAIGPAIISQNLMRIPLTIWCILEGFWIFYAVNGIAAFGLTSAKRTEKIEFICLSLAILVTFLTAWSVTDITRSMMYAFPAVLIMFRHIRKYNNLQETRSFALISFLFSFLFPTVNFFLKHKVAWVMPNLGNTLKYLLGK